MIRTDWRVALAALQVLTEERTGRAVRAELGLEDDAMAASRKALGG